MNWEAYIESVKVHACNKIKNTERNVKAVMGRKASRKQRNWAADLNRHSSRKWECRQMK